MMSDELKESPQIRAALERVESILKELQVVVVDVAVVKSKMVTAEENIGNIYKALFNGSNPNGSLIDRTTRLEDSVKELKGLKIEERLLDIEHTMVKKEDCSKKHGEISSKLWKILLPVITGFIIVAATVIFNDIFVSRSDASKNSEQMKVMRQMIQEELKAVYVQPKGLQTTP